MSDTVIRVIAGLVFGFMFVIVAQVAYGLEFIEMFVLFLIPIAYILFIGWIDARPSVQSTQNNAFLAGHDVWCDRHKILDCHMCNT